MDQPHTLEAIVSSSVNAVVYQIDQSQMKDLDYKDPHLALMLQRAVLRSVFTSINGHIAV